MARFFALPLALIILATSLSAGAAQDASQGTIATGWPKTFNENGVKIVVYQPQVVSWPNYTVLNGLAAVQVTLPASTPVFGTVKLTSYTSANFDDGTVVLAGSRITSTTWPGVSGDVAERLDDAVKNVQLNDKTIPLASVLAGLEAAKSKPKPAALKSDPPVIYTSEKPAILVVFDGKPIMAPIAKTKLTFAVNTNWAVIRNTDGTYYLLNGEHWLSAHSAQGPWSGAVAPKAFSQIPNDGNWTEVHQYLNAAPPERSAIPAVYVSTVPADLIAIDGSPKLQAVSGTSLSYVENTPSDLYYYRPQSQWYVLLSGRWFRAAGLDGPWTFATPSLPADFARIPLNGPRGRDLVSVPGTPESQYAATASQIPSIASVNPANTKLDVVYSGDPSFKPISGTNLSYAVNTSYDVIKISESEYYACHSGVWFTASDPKGPWAVAAYVPQEIYAIPPSSPLFQDTFVHIYSSTGTVVVVPPTATPQPSNGNAAAAAILVGFTAGYLTSYWWNGAWVYGTGWYYPPYYFPGAYPIYYPYAGTWTGGSYYNPATGAYGRYASYYGPYGGATARAVYNPTTGTYARGAAAYGPNGAVGAGSFYNPRYGVGGRTVQGSSPYGSWGRTAVTTPRGNAYMGHSSTSAGSVAGISTKNGNAVVGKSNATGDVYAGHDGNVYKNSGGSWQKYDNGGWNDVQKPNSSTRPATTGANGSMQRPSGGSMQKPAQMPSGLDRDFSARQAGSSGGFRGFGGSFDRGGGGGFDRGGFDRGGFGGGGGFRGGGGGGFRR